MDRLGGRRFENAELTDDRGVTKAELAELDEKLQQMVAGFPKVIGNEPKKAGREEGAETRK